MRRRAALFQDDADGRRRLRYHSLTQPGPAATAVECIRNAAACRTEAVASGANPRREQTWTSQGLRRP